MTNFKTYSINGKEYTRVSSILACLPKPWKDNYIKSKAMESLWDMVNTKQINYTMPSSSKEDASEAMVPLIEKEELKHCLDASDRHGKDAAEQGSEIHSMIEVYEKLWFPKLGYSLFLDEYHPELLDSFNSYMEIVTDNNMKILESEQTVHYDGDTPYAGTLDLIAEMDGELWIGDIKTYESKVSWKAYKKCPDCEGEGRIESGVLNARNSMRDCPKCSGTGKSDKTDRKADTKEELIHKIKNKKVKNPELKIPRNYILEEVVEPPMVKKDHLIQCEAYRRAYNWMQCKNFNCNSVDSSICSEKGCNTEGCLFWHTNKMIKNRFILYLCRRDRSNYSLYKIDPSTSDSHWILFCSAYDIFKNY